MQNSDSSSSSISWRIDTWFPQIDAARRNLLKSFFNDVIKFSRTINLVSAKTLPLLDLVHFADSICAAFELKKLIPTGSTIYDIGSGNGFPGIVMACILSDYKFVLVDTDQRKCEFLKHAVSTLGLSNVSVINSPIESLPEASIDFAVSRGFASISKSLLLTRKAFKTGGNYFHLKGDQWGLEVAAIPTQLCSAWSPALSCEYVLPGTSVKLFIVKTTKILK